MKENLKKENVYVSLKGKSKEELTDLYEFLKINNEPIYRTKERFLEYNDCYLVFFGEWEQMYIIHNVVEVTIEQLKQIIKQNRIEEINDRISEIDKPKVGDIGLFWNNEKNKHISILEEIDEHNSPEIFVSSMNCWSNFEPLPTELQEQLKQYLK